MKVEKRDNKLVTQEMIKLLDCGIRYAEWDTVLEDYQRPLIRAFTDFPDDPSDFLFCVKVHMLMPNQWPCIPNWHRDHIPRVNKELRLDLIDTRYPMYLWISNPPLTEFECGRKITPQKWERFTQQDLHRGTMSDSHIWRVFIRATHKNIVPDGMTTFKPRHSQVYLDSGGFTW